MEAGMRSAEFIPLQRWKFRRVGATADCRFHPYPRACGVNGIFRPYCFN